MIKFPHCETGSERINRALTRLYGRLTRTEKALVTRIVCTTFFAVPGSAFPLFRLSPSMTRGVKIKWYQVSGLGDMKATTTHQIDLEFE